MKIAALKGPALDYAVALALRFPLAAINIKTGAVYTLHGLYAPSTSWEQGGPIIEREHINLSAYELDDDGLEVPGWQAWPNYGMSDWYQEGPTPLVAAMRCFVVSKLGKDLDIPKELQ